MKLELSGWFVVTGAAGYLGRNICLEIVNAGGKVIGIDLTEAPSALDSISFSLRWLKGNLLEPEFVERVISVCSEQKGLNGLVNNAALVGTDALEKWKSNQSFDADSAWNSTLELNLTVPFKLSRGLSGLFIPGSSIVNVCSIYGVVAPSWQIYSDSAMNNPAAYGASKAGLIQLTRWLSSVLAPTTRVNAVSPGGISREGQHPDFVDNYKGMTHLDAMANESQISSAVVFLLSSASGYVTGHNLVVDGGFTVS